MILLGWTIHGLRGGLADALSTQAEFLFWARRNRDLALGLVVNEASNAGPKQDALQQVAESEELPGVVQTGLEEELLHEKGAEAQTTAADDIIAPSDQDVSRDDEELGRPDEIATGTEDSEDVSATELVIATPDASETMPTTANVIDGSEAVVKQEPDEDIHAASLQVSITAASSDDDVDMQLTGRPAPQQTSNSLLDARQDSPESVVSLGGTPASRILADATVSTDASEQAAEMPAVDVRSDGEIVEDDAIPPVIMAEETVSRDLSASSGIWSRSPGKAVPSQRATETPVASTSGSHDPISKADTTHCKDALSRPAKQSERASKPSRKGKERASRDSDDRRSRKRERRTRDRSLSDSVTSVDDRRDRSRHRDRSSRRDRDKDRDRGRRRERERDKKRTMSRSRPKASSRYRKRRRSPSYSSYSSSYSSGSSSDSDSYSDSDDYSSSESTSSADSYFSKRSKRSVRSTRSTKSNRSKRNKLARPDRRKRQSSKDPTREQLSHLHRGVPSNKKEASRKSSVQYGTAPLSPPRPVQNSLAFPGDTSMAQQASSAPSTPISIKGRRQRAESSGAIKLAQMPDGTFAVDGPNGLQVIDNETMAYTTGIDMGAMQAQQLHMQQQQQQQMMAMQHMQMQGMQNQFGNGMNGGRMPFDGNNGGGQPGWGGPGGRTPGNSNFGGNGFNNNMGGMNNGGGWGGASPPYNGFDMTPNHSGHRPPPNRGMDSGWAGRSGGPGARRNGGDSWVNPDSQYNRPNNGGPGNRGPPPRRDNFGSGWGGSAEKSGGAAPGWGAATSSSSGTDGWGQSTSAATAKPSSGGWSPLGAGKSAASATPAAPAASGVDFWTATSATGKVVDDGWK